MCRRIKPFQELLLESKLLQLFWFTFSLIGAVGVIVGLYVVLWGKAQDHEELKTDTVSISNDDQSTIAEILVDGSSKNMTCTSTTDLEKPFLFV